MGQLPSSFRDRRVPNFDNVDPDIKPMYQDSTNVGTEYQLMANTVFGVHYVHNNLRRTIEDLGALDATATRSTSRQPRRGPVDDRARQRPDAARSATPKPKRQYDALEFTLTRRFANNWFCSASYIYSRLYGNYAGLANSDEIPTPTTNVTSATAQQQAGSIARPGGSANRAWDIDELLCGTRTATSTCSAGWRPIARTS